MGSKMAGLWLALALAAGVGAAQAQEEYEVGGPLFGVKLPLFPTQHGEKPGYPGSIPELQQKDERGNVSFTPEGQAPELQLYDGSVEHFHCYWFKYLPVRSFFDRQSLVKNWLAKDIPGVEAGQAEDYAEPVYWVPRHSGERPTGRFNKPVKVVRCKPKSPVFTLDLGELPVGMYALRVIGAVETPSIQRHRKPLCLRMSVNDGLGGEVRTYRFRCKYVDEFYAVAEFYFHAPDKRAYRATLMEDEGSLVELLVHNIDLHDALAGSTLRAIKTRVTMGEPRPGPVTPVGNDEQRLARDAALWDMYPNPNAQLQIHFGMGGDDGKSNWPNFGAGGQTPEQIKEQWGDWQPAPMSEKLLVNAKLKLAYTVEDLNAGRPLPDPYPYKDNGCGVYTPAAKQGEDPQNWYPVSIGVQRRKGEYSGAIGAKAGLWRTKGDAAAGRDAALMLCRMAYDFPAGDVSNALHSIIVQPGPYGRDMGCRRRDPRGADADVGFLRTYDELFELIKADAGLAESVGRFVPWVKTPEDVIKLIDVYMVQTLAKKYLRYHMYWSNEPACIVTPAIVLGDTSVTDPWMEWLFSKTFVYPLPPSGIQDLLVTGNDRDGVGYIGSYSYASGEQAAPQAKVLERYVAAGGNPKFDLKDPKRYPKPIAACYWYLTTRMAGLYWPRVGDVAGPEKTYGQWFSSMEGQCRLGWAWTKDPRFAYVLKHFSGRKGDSDAEWAELEQAAAQQKRAPWLETRSRVLPYWFGLLEAGIEHDDFRFRRDVMVRIGQGWGHSHADTLDLQIHAHGYPMTIDGGQRGGYSQPGDSTTRIHNVVEMDNAGWMGHSWVRALSDAPGAKYLAAEALAPPNHSGVRLHRRQVALVDVDEGAGSKPLMPEQLRPETKLDPDVVTPNSYLFDVVRVDGGKTYTYCFHATVDDELTTNVEEKQSWEQMSEADRGYLGIFPDRTRSFAGRAPEVVEATWRMLRGPMWGNEKMMAGMIFDEKSPRKYTRLHLFGHGGARLMSGYAWCRQWKYGFTNVYVQERREQDGGDVFAAVIEPYVGEPFVAERRLLEVAGNDADALRAVAVEVKTKNGRTDVCFADGRPDKERGFGDLKAAAEFAYCSRDDQGLRQATITGGRLLAGPDFSLRPAEAERTGTVTKADYPEKTMTIDRPWPAGLESGRAFEVGLPGHMTTYTAAEVKRAEGGSAIVVQGGADFYLARVREVDPKEGIVYTGIGFPQRDSEAACPGLDKHWVASNEGRTKFWRAEYVGGSREERRYGFRLSGAPVSMEDFGASRGMCLWEYGAGDQVRQSTFASLRRLAPGAYELTADVDVEVTLPGGKSRKVTVEELARNNGAVRIGAGD